MPAFALLAASLPLRVASLNLCTDEYLLLLARPERIVSVSYLSRDPHESPLWKIARRYRGNLRPESSAVPAPPMPRTPRGTSAPSLPSPGRRR